MIVALYPEARSRLIGGYMVFYSIGSAAGAAGATVAYAHGGWLGVSALGAAFSTAALLIWASTVSAVRSSARSSSPRSEPRFDSRELQTLEPR